MADAVDLKSTEGNLVWVRLPPAPFFILIGLGACTFRCFASTGLHTMRLHLPKP